MAKKIMSEVEHEAALETRTFDAPAGKRSSGKSGLKKFFMFVLVIIAISGAAGSMYFYNKYKALNVDANVKAEQETQKLIEALGNLMELPQGETPTIATISDKEKLKGQVFFAQAENGDILFAYTNSMKAILYRPSTHKIINVAPISINQPQDVTSAVQQVAPAPKPAPVVASTSTSASGSETSR